MKKILLISLFLAIFSQVAIAAPTYGNWSGVIRTQSIPVRPGNPHFKNYTAKIQDYLLKNYQGRYVQLITYVVKKGQRYTVSIRFPQDGIDRGLSFIGYDPFSSRGFSISYQNRNTPGKQIAHRINFSNSRESDYDRVVVVVTTHKPSMPFYLRIQSPAVPDSVVDSASLNPGDPSLGKMYWGTIIKEPLLLK